MKHKPSGACGGWVTRLELVPYPPTQLQPESIGHSMDVNTENPLTSDHNFAFSYKGIDNHRFSIPAFNITSGSAYSGW